MLKKMSVFGLLFMAFNATAADIDMSNLDRELRGTTSKSIMFRRNNADAEETARAEAEAAARAEAERESKLRQEQAVFRPYNLFGNGLKIVATINGEMKKCCRIRLMKKSNCRKLKNKGWAFRIKKLKRRIGILKNLMVCRRANLQMCLKNITSAAMCF